MAWCRKRVAAPSATVAIVVLRACLPTEDTMATTLGDAAEFLDVNVDQVAWGGVFVSSRPGPTDRETGCLIEVVQRRHPIAVENPADGRSRNTQVVTAPVRTPPSGEAQRDDPPLGSGRTTSRRPARTPGQIRHRPPGPHPIDPLLCRRRGTLEPFRSSPQRPALIQNQNSQTATPFRRQRCISVSHEDLR